jgi:hypothetical protein
MKTLLLSLGLLTGSAMAMEISPYKDLEQNKEEQSSSGSDKEEAGKKKKVHRTDILKAITEIGINLQNVKEQLDAISKSLNRSPSELQKATVAHQPSGQEGLENNDNPEHEIRPDYVTVGICALTLFAVFFGR